MYKPKMNSDLIIVKVLINRVLFIPMLINTGYEYYTIMDKNLVTELRLPCIKIPPKPIINFVKENTKEPGVEITKIAKFFIDIQRYRRNIFAYMVFILLNPVIIEL